MHAAHVETRLRSPLLEQQALDPLSSHPRSAMRILCQGFVCGSQPTRGAPRQTHKVHGPERAVAEIHQGCIVIESIYLQVTIESHVKTALGKSFYEILKVQNWQRIHECQENLDDSTSL